jgi:hypothetical protein
MYSFVQHNGLLINNNFLRMLQDAGLADYEKLKFHEDTDLIKKTRFRSVIRLDIQGRPFFLKRHFRPLRERLQSLIPLTAKEDAGNEWSNMLLLDRLGIRTMVPVAFGEESSLGMPSFSLTLTEGLSDAVKLKPYIMRNFAMPLSPDSIIRKRELIRRMAAFVRDFHNKGFNHQDMYLGHLFYRESDSSIFVTDIQRVHQRSSIRKLDRIKDLAQLCYSAMTTGVISRTDLMRFAYDYFQCRKLGRQEKGLIRSILWKAGRISRHDKKLRASRKEKGQQAGAA